jgi:hypothetical protein|tara:strand:+ start:31 stop:399 length:369 start_codon:yes stop_codon:yes gene_type:complete
MAAGIYNFTLEQGTTFIRIFNYKDSNGNPINLNEATELRMQIRESVGSENPVVGGSFGLNSGFTTSIPAGGSVQSQFTLIIPAATSSAFTFDKAVYDIELLDNGVTTRLIQGKIKLSKEVTR